MISETVTKHPANGNRRNVHGSPSSAVQEEHSGGHEALSSILVLAMRVRIPTAQSLVVVGGVSGVDTRISTVRSGDSRPPGQVHLLFGV
ncbi:hypothetical protein CBL_12539 [Carabus blaptoides fortunei]